MTRTFVEIFFPGSFFDETRVEEVQSRAPIDLPSGAFGYRFFDKIFVIVDGEELSGGRKNFSCNYYKGTSYTLSELEKKFEGDDEYRILLSNLRSNKWGRAVQTIRGNWKPLQEGDTVI